MPRLCQICDDPSRLAGEEDMTSCDACDALIHKDCAIHRKATFATPEGSFCDTCTGAVKTNANGHGLCCSCRECGERNPDTGKWGVR
jgi:hypothetical protein